jgi:hypothetical protein
MNMSDLEQIEKRFSSVMDIVLNEARKNLELAEAMNDQETAAKERTKIATFMKVSDCFQAAKTEGNLEAIQHRYLQLLASHQRALDHEIAAAQASGNQSARVLAQIARNITEEPAQGIFRSACHYAEAQSGAPRE